MKMIIALTAFLALAACGPKSDDAPASHNGSSSSKSADIPATAEERGHKLFKECAICHSVKKGDANRVGPNLFGVVGRKAAGVDGFAYSKAMQDSGIIWDDETLSAYLENPQAFLRGNRMAYAGQSDPEKRADLIAYLKTLK